jgi:hypothetical protein
MPSRASFSPAAERCHSSHRTWVEPVITLPDSVCGPSEVTLMRLYEVLDTRPAANHSLAISRCNTVAKPGINLRSSTPEVAVVLMRSR